MTLGQVTPTRADEHAKQDETGLRTPIIHAIRSYANNLPRNLQRSVGPSQVGTPCARQLAYQLSDMEPARDMHDPWPSIVGTAVHAWLADAMEAANRPGEPAEWITERRVDVGFGLTGSCDVFHVPTGSVLDWKVLGDSQYRKYVAEGPSPTYRTQAHCYGMGYARAGFQVKRVGIVFLGRAKRLSDLHIWSEPWDDTVALGALKRLLTLRQVMASRQADGTPVPPSLVPATPGGQCYFCSWKSPGGKGEDGYCCVSAKE